MPLVWLARLCGFPASSVHRNTQLDWFPDLLQKLSEGQQVAAEMRGMKYSPPVTGGCDSSALYHLPHSRFGANAAVSGASGISW